MMDPVTEKGSTPFGDSNPCVGGDSTCFLASGREARPHTNSYTRRLLGADSVLGLPRGRSRRNPAARVAADSGLLFG
jgi:hypothetical protein